ncbi:hypothetical protein [Acidovorax radicis]|uniref:hypothetical protein n=1 Tax=Acidovorax radicis TaxID=758826 RepID=UPI00023766C5|nr:hypothetical protein [Acidovorax radicis]
MDDLRQALSDLQKDFLPFAPPLLTILGWSIVAKQAAQREVRKERRTEVDACCKMAAEILVKARTYYTKDPSDAESLKLEREIKFELYRLAQRVERLEKACPKFEVQGTWSELQDAATGGDFESATRPVRAHSDSVISNIEHWTHQLIDQLEAGFALTYP